MAAMANSTPRTAAALGAVLRATRVDAVELAERTLAAINSHSDKAIFTEVFAVRARREAAAAAARLKAGRPLSPGRRASFFRRRTAATPRFCRRPGGRADHSFSGAMILELVLKCQIDRRPCPGTS